MGCFKTFILDSYDFLFSLEDKNLFSSLIKPKDNNLLDLNYFNIFIIDFMFKYNYEQRYELFSYKPFYIKIKSLRNDENNTLKKILKLIGKEEQVKFDNFLTFYKKNQQEIENLLYKKLLSTIL